MMIATQKRKVEKKSQDARIWLRQNYHLTQYPHHQRELKCKQRMKQSTIQCISIQCNPPIVVSKIINCNTYIHTHSILNVQFKIIICIYEKSADEIDTNLHIY